MKHTMMIALLLTGLTMGVFADTQKGFKDRPITNNIMIPTGYTLNKGEFKIGLGNIGFGVSDKVQVGTNVLLFILQDYNVNMKVSLLKNEKNAFAAGFKLHRFNLKVFGADENFNSFSPFAVFSTNVSKKTKLHIGGQYSYFSGDRDIDDAEADPTTSGSSVYAGLEHSFSNKTKFLAETGYDFTFKGFRIGGAVLFGWKSLRLKLGGNYFKQEGRKGYIFPTISLWWRFKG